MGSYRENDQRLSQLCLMPLIHFRAIGQGPYRSHFALQSLMEQMRNCSPERAQMCQRTHSISGGKVSFSLGSHRTVGSFCGRLGS